ncbi:hypothetical protein L2E82_12191 [Cichorium intybus]|uniref:Uncharacterized protein n=1 Tax=Cichorium intybus TaxID=13427 RepID=A0ACB9GHC9_CICIN|nr:hypothetical protein L2E82_12191 [Cichorium intybus]
MGSAALTVLKRVVIGDQEEEARKNQSLKSILESPSCDFVISTNGETERGSIEIKEKKGKRVVWKNTQRAGDGAGGELTVDAFIYAIEREGYGEIPVAVMETGWPTAGGEVASGENELAYNGNVVKRGLNNVGTLKRLAIGVEVFLFGFV